jgi:hypothetical protein
MLNIFPVGLEGQLLLATPLVFSSDRELTKGEI